MNEIYCTFFFFSFSFFFFCKNHLIYRFRKPIEENVHACSMIGFCIMQSAIRSKEGGGGLFFSPPWTKLEIKRSHAWTDAGEFLETTFPGVVRAEISANAKYFSHIKCAGRIKQRTCPWSVQGIRWNAGRSSVFRSEFPVACDF